MSRRRRTWIAVVVTALVMAVPAVALAAPEGQMTFALHFTLAPTLFEPAETPGHVVDHLRHGRIIGDVTAEGGGVDLMPRCEVAGDALRLVAALGVHDLDMRALLRQRVADALPEPAIAARHQGHRTVEVHRLSPVYGRAVVAQRRCVRSQFGPSPGSRQAVDRQGKGECQKGLESGSATAAAADSSQLTATDGVGIIEVMLLRRRGQRAFS